MMVDWTEPESYHMIVNDGEPPVMIAFLCENDDSYHIRLENIKTAKSMFIDLSPRQALDLAHRLANFCKRMQK